MIRIRGSCCLISPGGSLDRRRRTDSSTVGSSGARLLEQDSPRRALGITERRMAAAALTPLVFAAADGTRPEQVEESSRGASLGSVPGELRRLVRGRTRHGRSAVVDVPNATASRGSPPREQALLLVPPRTLGEPEPASAGKGPRSEPGNAVHEREAQHQPVQRRRHALASSREGRPRFRAGRPGTAGGARRSPWTVHAGGAAGGPQPLGQGASRSSNPSVQPARKSSTKSVDSSSVNAPPRAADAPYEAPRHSSAASSSSLPIS